MQEIHIYMAIVALWHMAIIALCVPGHGLVPRTETEEGKDRDTELDRACVLSTQKLVIHVYSLAIPAV